MLHHNSGSSACRNLQRVNRGERRPWTGAAGVDTWHWPAECHLRDEREKKTKTQTRGGGMDGFGGGAEAQVWRCGPVIGRLGDPSPAAPYHIRKPHKSTISRDVNVCVDVSHMLVPPNN